MTAKSMKWVEQRAFEDEARKLLSFSLISEQSGIVKNAPESALRGLPILVSCLTHAPADALFGRDDAVSSRTIVILATAVQSSGLA